MPKDDSLCKESQANYSIWMSIQEDNIILNMDRHFSLPNSSTGDCDLLCTESS